VLQIESASLSDQGRKRQNNEDFVASFEPEDPEELNASGCLYLVADGVGGAIKGEKASRYAVQKVLFEYYRHPELTIEERLQQSMHQAGNDIYIYAQQNHERRMATTMVVAAVRDDKLTIANVGDSRAYLIRGGEIQQLTHDHNLVGEMVRDGLLSEEESHRSRVKNLLTRSLGGELDVAIDIFADIPLQEGDRILLCTDGLSRYASLSDLLCLASKGRLEEVVEGLIAYANQQGGVDNISAILIAFGPEIVGQELILQKRSGQSTADWENIPTLVEIEKPVKKMSFYFDRRYLAWGVLVVIFLLIFSGILVGISKLTRAVLPMITATNTDDKSAVIITSTLANNQELIPTAIQASQTTQNPQVLVSTTQSSTGISVTEVPLSTPTISPGRSVCVYKTEDAATKGLSKYLSVILADIFVVRFDPDMKYYYYECGDDKPPNNCGNRIQIPDNNNIFDEWWIEIPDITADECTTPGGYLIQLPKN